MFLIVVLKHILDNIRKIGNLGGHEPQKGELQGNNLKLTLDILELMIKNKKKVLGGFNGSYLRNLVGWALSFVISQKGAF